MSGNTTPSNLKEEAKMSSALSREHYRDTEAGMNFMVIFYVNRDPNDRKITIFPSLSNYAEEIPSRKGNDTTSPPYSATLPPFQIR